VQQPLAKRDAAPERCPRLDLVISMGSPKTATGRLPPLHERIRFLGWLRSPLRRALFACLDKIATTDDAKAIAAATLRGLLNGQHGLLKSGREKNDSPYADLQNPPAAAKICRRSDVIFITARFRTGSTLLWNLFRNIEGVTAYYEPLNERRWFDPSRRGERLDATHRNVAEYWREYEGLEELGNYYQETWINHNLLMGPDAWDPLLKRYVEVLIDKARGRPVFQFNRIDFRLPWFRRNFPGATIVHLYRHPRDQWCSCFPEGDFFPPDGALSRFAPYDHFYLLNWTRDLRYHFPFLDERGLEHPYQLFYLIWRLSYLFGRQYAHSSLAYEMLVNHPTDEITRLLRSLGISGYDLEKLRALVDKHSQANWKRYATHEWFRRHEMICDNLLDEFLQPDEPVEPVKECRPPKHRQGEMPPASAATTFRENRAAT
jgi:Sulfotransferase family